MAVSWWRKGQFFGLTFSNQSASSIYATVLHVRATGAFQRLTNHPRGIEVNTYFTLGTDDTSSELVGFGLTWPEGVPRDQPVDEEIFVLLTNESVDLQCLETYGVRSEEQTRGNVLSTEKPLRHAVRMFSYKLKPPV